MKNRLSDAEYQEVLDCIEGVHRCRKLDEFPQHVLTELRKIIDCNVAGYNEVDLPRNRIIVVFEPPRPEISPAALEPFARLMHEHPVITYFDRTGDGQALKISDFLTAREYHQRAIYRDFYKHIGAEDQISFAVQISPGFMIGIAFNRGERSFSEKDRLRLNLMRPHIVQAYLYAAELTGHTQRQVDLHAVLRESGLGVIATDRDGLVAHSTPGALECLAQYLPNSKTDPPRLPRRLTEWLAADTSTDAHAPFVLMHDLAKLIVRRVRSEERWLLLLSEENGLAIAQRLERFGLTPREGEVLRWLAEGKANSEISTSLGLTAGTVKLHVERILAKLGVENRTAAALIVHGVTSQAGHQAG
ncbi:MAG: helix-turn-helix transcriptional regulator [Chthoniobacter sp.]|uniref:response regulator transcription factor n=1 Tax=Chthoniobacter sp. TaxID=2510640 RepID=UPI0032A66C52